MSKTEPSTRSSAKPRKLTHDPGPGMSITQFVLIVIAVATMILTPLALDAMTDASGPIETLKILVIGVGAGAAAYIVNKYAIETLAPLAATGFVAAHLAAVLGILIVGFGTFLGSTTGIIYRPVERLVYEENGEALGAAIAEANGMALAATRSAPTTQAIAEDIERTATCEAVESCLSGKAAGGRGAMAIALEAWAAEAYGLVSALEEGAVIRRTRLDELNALRAAYLSVLADEELPVRDRRAKLQATHAEITQAISALGEALPIALARGFADKLRAGTVLSGDPTGGRLLSLFLREHGDALLEQLKALPDGEIAVPVFPAKPGMLDILQYLGAFAAIAAIVMVAELVVPMILYIIAFISRRWEIELELAERAEAEGDARPADRPES